MANGQVQYVDATAFSSGPVVIHLPADWKPNSTGRVVFCYPGHLAPETDWRSDQTAYKHIRELVRTGYCVVAFKTAQWGVDQILTDFDNLLAFAQSDSRIKARSGKVGIVGWSMGGMTATLLALSRASSIACVFLYNPSTDMRFASARTGYTPTYSISPYGSVPTTWQAEIDGLYSVSTGAAIPAGHDPLAAAVAGSYTSMPMTLVQCTDDATVPPALNTDATNGFAAKAGKCSLVTTTGGHLDPFTNVSASYMLSLMHQNLL